MRKISIMLITALFLGTSVSPSFAIDPLVNSKCTKLGNTITTAWYRYSCAKNGRSLVWSVAGIAQQTPANYKSGFLIGQDLGISTDTFKSGAEACLSRWRADFPGESEVFSTYEGLTGCLNGFDLPKSAIPDSIILEQGVPFGGNNVFNLTAVFKQLNYWNVEENAKKIGLSSANNDMNWILSNQYVPAMTWPKSPKAVSCIKQRYSSHWQFDYDPIFSSMKYTPGWTFKSTSDDLKSVASMPSEPLAILVIKTEFDDNTEIASKPEWLHFVWVKGQPQFFESYCPSHI